MGYAVYRIGHGRWGGYGVPAYCEHPECSEEIDRGMAFACGGEPGDDHGCDMYFCEKHREYTGFKGNGESYPDYLCDCDEDCECTYKEVCHPCASNEPSYPYKHEHPDWIKHLQTDESWKDWRDGDDPYGKELLTPSPL